MIDGVQHPNSIYTSDDNHIYEDGNVILTLDKAVPRNRNSFLSKISNFLNNALRLNILSRELPCIIYNANLDEVRREGFGIAHVSTMIVSRSDGKQARFTVSLTSKRDNAVAVRVTALAPQEDLTAKSVTGRFSNWE